MKIRQLVMVAAVSSAVMLGACGGGEKKNGSSGGGAGNSDRVVIGLKSSPANLDPRVGNDNASGRIFDLCCRGLVRVTPEMDYAPDLADRWETPDDRTVIFHLNPNAKFQDGRPLTAQDVKWTYDSVMAPDFTSSKKSGYSAVESIEAQDAHTVVFHLKEPNGGLFDNLNMGIVPQGTDTNVAKTKFVSSGPYKVVSFKTDESVELEASEFWHQGAPKIKHLTVRIIPDMTTMVLEMRRGTLDLEINQIPFENVAEFESSPKHQVVKKAGSVWQYLAFNLKDPTLSKVEVRRAIAHAIDRNRIVKDLLRGYGVPTDTMFGEGHWARATNLPTYEYNPAKAKQLLDQAGFKDPDGDGPRPRFTISMKTSTDTEANLRAQMIQQMLQQVGIKMEIQTNEFGTFMEDVSKGNFQMYSLSRNGIQDPDFYYVIFHSKNVPPEGQNRGYYNNPKVDQLIADGRATFDRTKRKQIYGDIQRIVQEDLPYISLYHQINVAVMDKDLQGYTMYPAGFWLGIPAMSRSGAQ
ncbi:MAG TPA: ABC transporter substrate-binding protein [Thermoanaerobaculia bacterium]|nr:ABC transporter substrate-binding protein [Thermoanaerobaculia bacterium]